LLKPFEEEELLARVENLLRNYDARRQISEDVENEEDEEPILNPEAAPTNNPSQITNNQSEWLAALEQVVSKSMTKLDFTTDSVAEQLFMGRSQFFKKVKQLTGITPNEYVQEMRLTQARNLLENRRVTTVKEAAFSVGFKDVRYFSELFKKRFGKLPSEYLS
jgi:AraC-like DNA-binding protein